MPKNTNNRISICIVHIINKNVSENIKYIGLQSKEQIQSLLLKCKALIFPSIWIESMPMTLIEAQTVGTIPIVAASINTNNGSRDGHLKKAEYFDVATFPKLTMKNSVQSSKNSKSIICLLTPK